MGHTLTQGHNQALGWMQNGPERHKWLGKKDEKDRRKREWDKHSVKGTTKLLAGCRMDQTDKTTGWKQKTREKDRRTRGWD